MMGRAWRLVRHWGCVMLDQLATDHERSPAPGSALPTDVQATLRILTADVVAVIGTGGAGITLVTADGYVSAAADCARTAAMEQLQHRQQEGPCVDAMHAQEVVCVPHLASVVARWPTFAPDAIGRGVLAVASVPLMLERTALGALGLYDLRTRPWNGHDLRIVESFASVVTALLCSAAKLDEQRRLTEHLQRALDHRIVIEQAKGVIAAERHISVEEAFVRLRRHANNHRAKLHDVADAVVLLGLRPD